jgi:hypothetical protein
MASARHGVREAPAGLALLQELLNTRAPMAYGGDLLLSADDAQRNTFENVILAAGKAELNGVLPPADVPVSLVPDSDGWVRMVPTGRGVRWLASALWAEALLAQQAGVWPRLKLCHNAECRAAFFDTSRNNSGVWHDVSTCGNTANLRAFRERKRLMGGSGGIPQL